MIEKKSTLQARVKEQTEHKGKFLTTTVILRRLILLILQTASQIVSTICTLNRHNSTQHNKLFNLNIVRKRRKKS